MKDQKDQTNNGQKPLSKKFVIFGIIFVVIVAIVVWLLVGYSGDSNTGEVQGTKTDDGQKTEDSVKEVPESKYFSEDAQIMYFYSDSCSWCQKQKVVLGELSSDGYKFKPMDVGKNTSLWQEYKIDGTPTFIAPNGDRLPGYTEGNELKKWVDNHTK